MPRPRSRSMSVRAVQVCGWNRMALCRATRALIARRMQEIMDNLQVVGDVFGLVPDVLWVSGCPRLLVAFEGGAVAGYVERFALPVRVEGPGNSRILRSSRPEAIG